MTVYGWFCSTGEGGQTKTQIQETFGNSFLAALAALFLPLVGRWIRDHHFCTKNDFWDFWDNANNNNNEENNNNNNNNEDNDNNNDNEDNNNNNDYEDNNKDNSNSSWHSPRAIFKGRLPKKFKLKIFHMKQFSPYCVCQIEILGQL